MSEWITGPEEAVTERAAAFIIASAYDAVARHRRFCLALAGGTTPRRLYRLLALGIPRQVVEESGFCVPAQARRPDDDPSRVTLPWDRTFVFWGDERCVPPDHPDSNFRMAKEALIGKAPLPAANVIVMEADHGEPDEAARGYERRIGRFFDRSPGKEEVPPSFDLVILGLGRDGHTASIFPEDAGTIGESVRWIVPVAPPHSASPRVARLTMTLPLINEAAAVMFLVPGDRYDLARAVRNGERPELPAAMVRPRRGSLSWFVEEAPPMGQQ